MKGTVYGGIVYFPEHPRADLHGHLRGIVRTDGITNLTSILRTYDIPFSPVLFNWSIWQESKSIVESQATEKEYGRLLVCAIVQQYVNPAAYETVPDSLKRTHEIAAGAELARNAAGFMASTLGPHLFTPWDGETGPRRACQLCTSGKTDAIHVKHTPATGQGDTI